MNRYYMRELGIKNVWFSYLKPSEKRMCRRIVRSRQKQKLKSIVLISQIQEVAPSE